MLQNGIYAASLTPLNAHLDIDVPTWARHVRWLLDNGCDGVVLFGTTGEANSFSVAERRNALDALLDEDVPADRLIVGTGCCAVPDTVALSRHAVERGTAGVLMLPPFYYKEVRDEGLFQAFDRVIQGVGDERLRILLYHFPRMSGVPFSHDLIERLAATHPDAIAGIKDSSGDWSHIEGLCMAFPDLQVFAGTEAFLQDVLEAGGAGCVSATVNMTSPLASSIYAGGPDGEVSPLQERLTTLRQTIAGFPMIPALKQITDWHYDHPGWRRVRPPLVPLDPETASSLKDAFTDLELPIPIS